MPSVVSQPAHSLLAKRTLLFRYFVAYAPVVLWAMLIFFFSAQSALPGLPTSNFDFILKKIAHMSIYGVFYWLLWRTPQITHPERSLNAWQQWLVPFLLVFVYAVSDEFHQSLTPGRHPSPRDVGFDLMGALLAFLRISRYI